MEARLLLATITVTGTGDTIALDGIVTLREAITAANTNAPSADAQAGSAGLDAIAFNIPGAGVQTIRATSDLPMITDPVTIDGYTQPGSHPNTNPISTGSNAVLLIELAPTVGNSFGLQISAGNSTVRGLAINRFPTGLTLRTSGGNTIAGNYLGTDPTGTTALGGETHLDIRSPNNTIGGTAPADRNLISGATLLGIRVASSDAGRLASATVILGNFIGTDAAGTQALPNHLDGVQIARASNVIIGGTAAGARNLISGNTRFGLILDEAAGAVIQGNFIGTDVTGTTKLGNSEAGLVEDLGRNNTIGGTEAGAGNVIAGNRGGLLLSRSMGDVIQGNFIGTDVTGLVDLGNTTLGMSFDQESRDITIGGTVAGSGNRIAFNGIGVRLDRPPINFLGNSVYDNRVGFQQVSYVGPQPPQLTAATSTRISGTLRATPNTTSRLEFFATPNTGQSDIRQAKTLLGTTDVITDGEGNSSFTFDPPGGVPAGQFLTATATDRSGTSFISTALNMPAAGAADLAVAVTDAPDPVAAGANLAYTIVVTNIGPDAAQGLTLTTAVPAGTTFVSFTAPAGWTATTPAAGGTGTITATAVSLGSGGAGPTVFTLVVRVSPGAAVGSMLNLSARVAATTADPTTANNSAAETTTVAATLPTNTAPTAVADAYVATAGVALTVPARGVLSNDTDPENNPLSAVVETGPAHGTLTLNADGWFAYTPAAGFSGADTFTYRASDGLLTSAPATVTLNVAAVPPSGDTTGPRLSGLQRFGFHAQPTRLVLAFDEGLAPAGASNLVNYRLVAAGRDGRFGTRDDVAIALRSATYDSTSRTVSLITRRSLPLRRPYRLIVGGAQMDLTGNGLNKNGDGTLGGDAVVRFDRRALAGPSVAVAALKRQVPSRLGRFSPSQA